MSGARSGGPGSAYEGICSNCGRTIRAALFFDWQGIKAPEAVAAECACLPFFHRVELRHVPGAVTTGEMRLER